MHHKWQSYDLWFLRYQLQQTDFFSHLGSLFALLPPTPLENENIKKMKKIPGDIIKISQAYQNHDHRLYCSWDMACDRHNCYFSFCAIFSLSSPKQPQKWKYKKMKIKTGDIIILHKCTKNHDHRLYCSWDMACDGCNYFSFLAIVCTFTPITAQKMNISKKLKQLLEISSFYTSVPQIMIICYTVP